MAKPKTKTNELTTTPSNVSEQEPDPDYGFGEGPQPPSEPEYTEADRKQDMSAYLIPNFSIQILTALLSRQLSLPEPQHAVANALRYAEALAKELEARGY